MQTRKEPSNPNLPIFTKDLIREVYKANVEKGFHSEENTPAKRQRLLLLVISEVAEAVEALRTDRYADIKTYEQQENDKAFVVNFVDNIKNSFEDELADVVIRLMDFAGCFALQIKPIEREYETEMAQWEWKDGESGFKIKDPSAFLFPLCKTITDIYYSGMTAPRVGEAIGKVHALARAMNIDLRWHIFLKLEYNKTRPFKNGKNF